MEIGERAPDAGRAVRPPLARPLQRNSTTSTGGCGQHRTGPPRPSGSDGREVAVKIQYPGAGPALMGDFNQLARFAQRCSRAFLPALTSRPCWPSCASGSSRGARLLPRGRGPTCSSKPPTPTMPDITGGRAWWPARRRSSSRSGCRALRCPRSSNPARRTNATVPAVHAVPTALLGADASPPAARRPAPRQFPVVGRRSTGSHRLRGGRPTAQRLSPTHRTDHPAWPWPAIRPGWSSKAMYAENLIRPNIVIENPQVALLGLPHGRCWSRWRPRRSRSPATGCGSRPLA